MASISRAPARQGLPKEERIRVRADYLRVQNGGRKFHTPSFICFGVLKKDAAPARLGITVSRRVGGAVVRNRIKRLLREAFRREKTLFPAGLELVIIARPEAATVDFADTERQLREVSRRICSAARPSAA